MAQLNPEVGNIAGNRAKILASIDEALARQADVVAFPELALTGYPPEDLLLRRDFVAESRAALDELEPTFRGTEPGVAEENIQARIRGNLLMACSNKFGDLVLTTGNKSEYSVGYATLYGDMSGGFAVLKDVFKTMVFRLAHYRNSLGPVIPENMISKAPTAELKPDQTDQDTLPPYEVLDAILKMDVEDDRSPTDIEAAGHDPAVVARVIRLVDLAEYKRRQSPPGVKITERAFGRDRRMPITNGFRKKRR